MLSVTTFWSYLREFSSLEVGGGEIGDVRVTQFRLPGSVVRLLHLLGREISVAGSIFSEKPILRQRNRGRLILLSRRSTSMARMSDTTCSG